MRTETLRCCLPNFFWSLPCVVMMVCIARWCYCDMVIAWLSVVMICLLMLVGLCDIVANHFRSKLRRFQGQAGGYHLAWEKEMLP